MAMTPAEEQAQIASNIGELIGAQNSPDKEYKDGKTGADYLTEKYEELKRVRDANNTIDGKPLNDEQRIWFEQLERMQRGELRADRDLAELDRRTLVAEGRFGDNLAVTQIDVQVNGATVPVYTVSGVNNTGQAYEFLNSPTGQDTRELVSSIGRGADDEKGKGLLISEEGIKKLADRGPGEEAVKDAIVFGASLTKVADPARRHELEEQYLNTFPQQDRQTLGVALRLAQDAAQESLNNGRRINDFEGHELHSKSAERMLQQRRESTGMDIETKVSLADKLAEKALKNFESQMKPNQAQIDALGRRHDFLDNKRNDILKFEKISQERDSKIDAAYDRFAEYDDKNCLQKMGDKLKTFVPWVAGRIAFGDDRWGAHNKEWLDSQVNKEDKKYEHAEQREKERAEFFKTRADAVAVKIDDEQKKHDQELEKKQEALRDAAAKIEGMNLQGPQSAIIANIQEVMKAQGVEMRYTDVKQALNEVSSPQASPSSGKGTATKTR